MQSVKMLLISLVAALSLSAQMSRPSTPTLPPNTNKIQATPQPAADITIHLSSDAMTALESLRLNTSTETRTTSPDGATTTVARTPVYATVQDLIDGVLRQKGGLLDHALTNFPPATLQDKIKAAVAAEADRDAAVAAAAAKK